jgi:hypothetical protein
LAKKALQKKKLAQTIAAKVLQTWDEASLSALAFRLEKEALYLENENVKAQHQLLSLQAGVKLCQDLQILKEQEMSVMEPQSLETAFQKVKLDELKNNLLNPPVQMTAHTDREMKPGEQNTRPRMGQHRHPHLVSQAQQVKLCWLQQILRLRRLGLLVMAPLLLGMASLMAMQVFWIHPVLDV